MKWFEGSIPVAIQTARQNNAVFIVFICGEDSVSSEMEAELHQSNVTQLCEENKCVAVKLVAGSNDSKFFSQIYPVVVIPSTFFIGDTGVPLEVIGEIKSSEDFFEKVKKALEAQKSQATPNPTASTQPARPEPPKADAVTSQAAAGPLSNEQGACSDGSGDDGACASASPDLSDKVERAKQAIEEKRREKAQKAFEEEKRREIERRGIGQGVQKLRQTQKEMEILEAKKELKRDKEEDRLARQRVKEEIARDRAEKAARFDSEKNARAKAAEEAKKKKLQEQQAALDMEQARRSEFSRIQFRLPDGSSITQQFSATDTFDTVYNFITAHVGSAVSLSTTFPRRTFTPADHRSTLQELTLAPSAAILVIPGRSSTSGVVNSSSSSMSLTSLFFAPFMFLWNIFASLFGLGRGSSSSSTSSSASTNSPQSSVARGGDRRPNSTHQQGSTSSRQEGAIHRFRNAQDDDNDDDRNTWNGNSTQQM